MTNLYNQVTKAAPTADSDTITLWTQTQTSKRSGLTHQSPDKLFEGDIMVSREIGLQVTKYDMCYVVFCVC